MIISKDGATSLKLETEWTDAKDVESLGNSKALNVIFNGMDNNMFRLIDICSQAKEACEILNNAHEGTSKVRMSMLQLLTTKFENLVMNEDETLSEFHIRLCDIANMYFSLSEKMFWEKLAIKILRSLPKRFDRK